MKYNIVFAVLFLTSCMDNKPDKTGMEGKVMPEFSLQMPDSTTWINTRDIKMGQPVVFFLFRPDCPHCKSQLEKMVNNMDDLKELPIYMITGEDFGEMKQFYQANQLDKYPNIKVCRDTAFFFGKYLNVKGVPYLALYNKNKQLARAFMGATSTQLIKSILVE